MSQLRKLSNVFEAINCENCGLGTLFLQYKDILATGRLINIDKAD